MQTELIRNKLPVRGICSCAPWTNCGLGSDGCIYAMISSIRNESILKIDPTDDTTTLLPLEIEGSWEPTNFICKAGPDGCFYGLLRGAFPSNDQSHIFKFDPTTQKVSTRRLEVELQETEHYTPAATFGPAGILYFFPCNKFEHNIIRYDPVKEFATLVGPKLEESGMWGTAAILAHDGCIYIMPTGSAKVMRFDPSDESITFIGNDHSRQDMIGMPSEWQSSVTGPDGNLYGIPGSHTKILKIDVKNQSTSLVGPDNLREADYTWGVLGHDQCVYLIPCNGEFVLRFNPITGLTSTVGKSLGKRSCKYGAGVLASNGYIYAIPFEAEQVLKIRSWDNWLYLKHRLLVEKRRATRKIIQFDDDLNIVQHFIIHTNDDIFRTVMELIE